MKTSTRKTWLVAGASSLVLGMSSAAWAQATPAADQPSALQEVVVTGTRIRNPGVISPTPLTILNQEQIAQTTPSSVSDVLAELPAFRQTTGPNQASRQSGSLSTGQSAADLRGLGTQRNLTLIDGQRPVPTAPDGTTSTSIIPLGLIKNIQIVTGGASAAYGSDAVAGVTNFVLKDRISGLDGSVFGGASQRGDNREVGLSLSGGFNQLQDRLHVVAGVDFDKNDGVGNIFNRPWGALQPGNSGTPIAFGSPRAAGTPANGWTTGVEYANETPGGIVTTATTTGGATSSALNGLAFGPAGTLSALARGPIYGSLMTNSTDNPLAGPLAQWQLKEPLTTVTSLGRATYDVTNTTEAFVQLGYARSSLFAISQDHQTPSDVILASNPYLSASTQALLAANNINQFTMGRVDTEWLGTTGDNVYTTIHTSAGLKGKLADRFDWSATYGFGSSIIDSSVYGTKEGNLAAAEYAVRDSSGNIVCGPLASNPNFAASKLTNTIQIANVQPGCVPLNPMGAGSPSAAAIAYVSGIERTKDTMIRHDAALNMSGPLIQLPAGPASFAVGVEYRYDSLVQTADAAQVQGLFSSGNSKNFSGTNDVKEIYGEVDAPILKDLPAVRSLGFNGAIRYTDYRISGAVDTWKVGGTWELIEALRLRITKSRDIRAPSLSDLYSVGGISTTGSFFNPWTGTSGRLPQLTLGNPNLKPEVADTFTTGVSWEGRRGWLTGLRLSVDYYQIKIQNVITSVAATDSITRCFNGITSYCGAIQFTPGTQNIASVTVQPFNASLQLAEGLDIEAGYRIGLTRFGLPGSVDASLFANYEGQLKTTTNGTTIDYAGTQTGAPKWVVSTFLTYRLSPFTVGLQAKAFTPILFSPNYIGPGQTGYSPALSNSISQNIFPGLVYFNLNGSYDVKGSALQIFANVNNLLDRSPPIYAVAAINLGGNPYDYVGRTFKAGVRFHF